ncbi:MAG: hypothetical protein ABSG94_06625 [Brevinematales bacterium]|jgi:hypothetical protein
MKGKLILSFLSMMLFSIIFAFAQEAPDDGMDGPDHPRPDMPRMDRGGAMGLYFVPGMQELFENYRIKILKVFTEAREEKIKLREKISNLRTNLDSLVERYPDDKSVSNDIVADIREIRNIHDQMEQINNSAMLKIRDLNDSRKKEMKAKIGAWLLKIETDQKEMGKFIDNYKSRMR